MKKSRIVTLLLLSGVLLLLGCFSGCERIGTELSELMIIQGIGIDAADEGVRVTIEILNNEQKGSAGGEDAGGDKTQYYTASGETVSVAIRSIVEQSGNTPLYAHNRVIVIGEELARKDLSDLLDFFQRDYNTRPTVLLAVSRGKKAEDVIRADLGDGIVHSEILENILLEGNLSTLCVKTRILDAINRMRDEISGTVIPAVTVGKSGELEVYSLDGTAVFGTDHKLTGYLDERETVGLLYLSNQTEKGSFSARLPEGGKVAFLLVDASTRVKPQLVEGKVVYRVHVKIKCDLNELKDHSYQRMDEKNFLKLKTAAAREVESRMYDALTVLQQEVKTDAVRYGRRFWRADTKNFSVFEENWAEIFPGVEVQILAEVTIRRIGEVSFFAK